MQGFQKVNCGLLGPLVEVGVVMEVGSHKVQQMLLWICICFCLLRFCHLLTDLGSRGYRRVNRAKVASDFYFVSRSKMVDIQNPFGLDLESNDLLDCADELLMGF
jgi:hypothetical protein